MTKIYKVAASAIMGAMFSLVSITAQAVPPKGATSDTAILECTALGGTIIKQPRGSSISACCYDDGCWICDAGGSNCTFDEAARKKFKQNNAPTNSGAIEVQPKKSTGPATTKTRAKFAAKSSNSLAQSLNRVPKSRMKTITAGSRGMRNVKRVVGTSNFKGCDGNLCICTGDKDCNDLFSGECSSPSSGGSCAGSGSSTICICNPKAK